ncbi:MAG: methylated-DNA--[protein]-cysteine S-methyltransferase [Oscillospiraceae bacterium]|nr:methylated-DNA--[protein]-cysteine S-methyltransferase [Oscillospiraceae bacterium]
MEYTCSYQSPLGDMLLSGDEGGLTGAWFVGQKYFALGLKAHKENPAFPVLRQAACWLDRYFRGENPELDFPLHPVGTDFQKKVWQCLLEIPHGKTTTYGDIAKKLARSRGIDHMSAQAVGGAVGHNRISIIIPCHRVVGAGGSLTGYAGGLQKKLALLRLEGVSEDGLILPKDTSGI